MLIQHIADETLLVDTRSSKCFTLERSGELTLQALLDGGVAEAVQVLESTYSLTHKSAQQDVDDFVLSLDAAGLIEFA